MLVLSSSCKFQAELVEFVTDVVESLQTVESLVTDPRFCFFAIDGAL